MGFNSGFKGLITNTCRRSEERTDATVERLAMFVGYGSPCAFRAGFLHASETKNDSTALHLSSGWP